MNLSNSAEVKNRIKLRSIIFAVAIYAILTVSTFGIILIVLLVTGAITNMICNKEIKSTDSNRNEFKKGNPFKFFGIPVGDFQHVYYHTDSISSDVSDTVANALTLKTPVNRIVPIKIRDVDKELKSPEEREFLKAESGTTSRGTSITLIIEQSVFGKMQSIRWWILAGGYIDKNKKFNFIAYSPILILFWLIPYLKKNHDILARLRNIYPAAYNDMDLITQIRCLHEAIFDALVEALEKNGIDTSDLKAQRMQVMNISISGGKVNMGNIVQGAMNKVASTVRRAK